MLNNAVNDAATGKFDAKAAIRSALTTRASNYISGELIKGFGLTLPKYGELAVNGVQSNFNPNLIRDRFGSQLISHGVNNVVFGKSSIERLDKLGRNFLVTESIVPSKMVSETSGSTCPKYMRRLSAPYTTSRLCRLRGYGLYRRKMQRRPLLSRIKIRAHKKQAER